MNKLLILFIIFIAILLIIFTLLTMWKNKTAAPKSLAPIPIMTSFPPTPPPSTPMTKELSIIAVDPTDNSANRPLDQKIKITFNRNFSADEIDFRWAPTVNYSTQIDNQTLTATPQAQLTPGITYAFYVVFKQTNQPSKLYRFTTAGEKPTTLPDTFPSGAAKQAEDYNRQNYPDIFLANKLPYSTVDFEAVKAGFKQGTPEGRFYFTVTLKGDTVSSKNAFISWLKSLGLTDIQIQGLDIEYQ